MSESDYIFYKEDSHPFSNFWSAPIEIWKVSRPGKSFWKTSEHYFQAMKFCGIDEDHDNYMEEIRLASSPGKAYKLGWARKPRSDWDSIRNDIMKTALMCKFSQHKELRNSLIDTGNNNIIQRCSWDKYWGDGYPEKGENMLGKLLMEVRDELR
jgi:N-glycosidase YbiA